MLLCLDPGELLVLQVQLIFLQYCGHHLSRHVPGLQISIRIYSACEQSYAAYLLKNDLKKASAHLDRITTIGELDIACEGILDGETMEDRHRRRLRNMSSSCFSHPFAKSELSSYSEQISQTEPLLYLSE